MDSRRFPGKALHSLQGTPLLLHVLRRAAAISGCARTVVATSNRIVDDPIVELANRNGFEAFRGSAADVAFRFLECAEYFDANYFLRVNGDSPCLDPSVADKAIHICREKGAEIVSNVIDRTFPYGVAAEVISTNSFKFAYPKFNAQDREHVTSYFYRNLNQFLVYSLTSPFIGLNKIRLTVDTPADADLMERIFDRLNGCCETATYEQFSLAYLSESGTQL